MRYGLKKMSGKSKYSIFSKDELVDFLDKYEDRFKAVFSPYWLLIQGKIDKKNLEIKENMIEGEKIYDDLKKTDDLLEKAKLFEKYKENHNKWLKLSKDINNLYEKKEEDIWRD
ncbi:hypothetical protein [Peptoanaerobacter stomatis]|uniref:hypothetical protein n=1 Tax=Peptoanaerobacter stomatis TaxID=796937 RepID=UPI003F9FFC4B